LLIILWMSCLLSPRATSLLSIAKTVYQQKKGQNLTGFIPNLTILAELIGYGSTADAYHMTEPAPGGEGLVRAIRRALQCAELCPEQVDYINAHGTATCLNDTTETQAVKACFGDHAYKLAMSSTKSMLGHTFDAAGAIEAVISILSIIHSIMPPTINLDYPDAECDLDYIPNQARHGEVRIALSN
jgi:3-oxoacyl-[acyl-carrier-protein] synthase II